jgi:hypothetical protein
MWSPIKLDFLFYNYFVIYYDFSCKKHKRKEENPLPPQPLKEVCEWFHESKETGRTVLLSREEKTG